MRFYTIREGVLIDERTFLRGATFVHIKALFSPIRLFLASHIHQKVTFASQENIK